MAFDSLEVQHLDVFNSVVGGGLIFPKIFTEPGGGILSVHKGHFGQGSSTLPYSASIVAGPPIAVPPAIPTPLTWNFLGIGLETGIRTLIGTDVKIGSNITLGALRACYASMDRKVVAIENTVTTTKRDITARHQLLSSSGRLLGNWTYNGRPLGWLHVHSDARIKKNVNPLNNSLDSVLKLNPVSYEWREDVLPSSFLKTQKEGRQLGLIAQEVEEVIPELVNKEKLYDNEWKGVDYARLTSVLIGAVKEQQEQIEELKTRIAVLESHG